MYNAIKKYKDKVYTGMSIGGSHNWNYNNGKWFEVKNAPDIWKFTFDCVKKRAIPAPEKSGVNVQTKYHWFIVANQFATKLDNDSYSTHMSGVKFKLGHKRPYWRDFSYKYPEQTPYKEKVIAILQDIIDKLKNDKYGYLDL